MPSLSVTYSNESQVLECAAGQVIGEVIPASGFPLEQPCAGRGTCGKCKVLAQGALAPVDETENKFLLTAEREANVRLACRARVAGDASVTLAPVVVYSNKIFTRSNQFRRNDHRLGLAVDLGSTTVAALLVSLETGEVYAGAAALNQQTIFGADVIARLDAAEHEAASLSALAQASIYQAIQALKLSKRVWSRIDRAEIVGNSAMHHLLMRYPVRTLAMMPFQPYDGAAIPDAGDFFSTLFPAGARVSLAPLIGGFVGSDTTACLAYFGYDKARDPMLAIDLGTNGEVMVTNGRDILVASTAAGPAFEGVNISCGTRAVDGAIVDAHVEDGHLQYTTIGNRRATGLTGSGLLGMVHALRRIGAVDVGGRLADSHDGLPIDEDEFEITRVKINERIALTQLDIRELQKAKAAIRVAADILMERLGVRPDDLKRLILTGSFGGQLNIDAALDLGLIPRVDRGLIELVPNGAGLGAAMFLREAGARIGEGLAARAGHVELDLEPEFNMRFVESMGLE
jgi:uncharacterized 2Fe-2S/4Fe-4S cluster protein (DUF4445 family)